MKLLLILLLPFSLFARKTYQLEVYVKSNLDHTELKGVLVSIFAEGKLLQEKSTDENGYVVFQGLSDKIVDVKVLADTSVFNIGSAYLWNKKRQDEVKTINLRMKEDAFLTLCTKIADAYFAKTGNAMEADTSNKCDTTLFINGYFPGDFGYLEYYLREFVKYPQDALELGEEGKVYVAFLIEPDGYVSKVVSMSKAHPSIIKEAERVISQMPRWIPSTCDGKRVRSAYTIPINFSLN